jgi:hypothetical protein
MAEFQVAAPQKQTEGMGVDTTAGKESLVQRNKTK